MTIAFKEWALICQALGDGGQSLILRKGGIAEGRAGFAFRHDHFLLFPTWFHEQLGKTTLSATTPLPPEPGETIDICFAATVEWSRLVTDIGKVRALRDHHIWRDSVVQERFDYDDVKGIHIALVRVFRLDPPLQIRNEKKYGGCRSWVELPDFDEIALVSVISDEEHQQRRRLIEELLA